MCQHREFHASFDSGNQLNPTLWFSAFVLNHWTSFMIKMTNGCVIDILSGEYNGLVGWYDTACSEKKTSTVWLHHTYYVQYMKPNEYSYFVKQYMLTINLSTRLRLWWDPFSSPDKKFDFFRAQELKKFHLYVYFFLFETKRGTSQGKQLRIRVRDCWLCFLKSYGYHQYERAPSRNKNKLSFGI